MRSSEVEGFALITPAVRPFARLIRHIQAGSNGVLVTATLDDTDPRDLEIEGRRLRATCADAKSDGLAVFGTNVDLTYPEPARYSIR